MKFFLLRVASFCLFGMWYSQIGFCQQTPLRVGKHNLTLQWISWDKPGSATITQIKGAYYIKGSQKSVTTTDSLTIEG